eukprot:6409802-Prymnesium_polylepis.1
MKDASRLQRKRASPPLTCVLRSLSTSQTTLALRARLPASPPACLLLRSSPRKLLPTHASAASPPLDARPQLAALR